MFLIIALLMTAATYQNPIWPEDFPDPFVVQQGSDFYAFGTQRDDSGFQMLHSKDLVHWEREPPVFKPSWSDSHYWAPEVHEFGGKWYLVYSAKNRTSQKHDIAIAVGQSAKGPFHELAKLIDGSSNEVGTIDATLFFEGETPYLLYSAERPRSIQMVRLSADFTHSVGKPQTLLTPDRPIEKGITEAPSLIKHGGRYWLFYSTGWFQSFKRDACYEVWVASSRSLFGPYAKADSPLIASKPDEVYSPGHQSILELPTGQTWIFYHAWDGSADPLYGKNRHGRTLRMDRLTWDVHGPHTNAPTADLQPAPLIH